MKNYFLNTLTILTIVLGSIAFTACDEEETPPTVSVSSAALDFVADGGSQQFLVTSNTSWQISGASDWCTVSPFSGSNMQNVVVTVKASSLSSARNCVLTISTADGKASTSVVVSQAGVGDGKSLAEIVSGTYVGKMMSGGEVIDDAYKIILTKLNSTSVEMNATFFTNPVNFNVSESQNQYVLTNANYSNMTATVSGKVLNVNFLNGAGTITTFTGSKD